MGFRVIVLISGRGSNLVSLLRNSRDYEISAVLSNRADAAGLGAAAEYGIPAHVVSRTDYPTLAAHKRAVFERAAGLAPDLVALAGYMQILEPEFVEHFRGRIVNIHPSLLPEYPGLDTHARALAAGAVRHGCTVHFVDAGVDTGPLIACAPCAVHGCATAEELAARVLEREHELYPWTVRELALGRIGLAGERVWYAPGVAAEAAARNFCIFESSEGERT